MILSTTDKNWINSMNYKNAAIFTAALTSMAVSAQMPLSQSPPLAITSTPKPNVLIIVDNSGSMNEPTEPGVRRSPIKMDVLKSALNNVFNDQDIVPDDAIRLGWMTINDRSVNLIQPLTPTRRNEFLRWINRLTPSGGTPLQQALWTAGKHYQTEWPWRDNVFDAQSSVSACRRAYSILLSDGAWTESSPLESAARNIGNLDNAEFRFPDGTHYQRSNTETFVYRDLNGSGYFASDRPYLADVAFHFWSTDLNQKSPNEVPPIFTIKDKVTYGQKVISPYWNPRNNPATWQHMVTYTIGFGREASDWSGYPRFGADTWSGPDYARLVGRTAIGGRDSWPDGHIQDLWHAAINSRGEYYPVRSPQDLAPAFTNILSQIQQVANAPAIATLVASSRSTRTGSNLYSAGYDPASWSGKISAYEVKDGAVGASIWGAGASTASKLDAKTDEWARATRNVLTSKDATGTPSKGGRLFKWGSLSDAQKTILSQSHRGLSDNQGETRLHFLRGDRSIDKHNDYRARASRHGDIINSQLWRHPGNATHAPTARATRPDMLYIGANDGMLHGFNASNGNEEFAYVPQGVLPRLSHLSNPSYEHLYFVDGSAQTGDIEHQNGQWKTLLTGSLGAGGKGYFVLDVTTPNAFTPANVVLDATFAADNTQGDADIGHIFSAPVLDLYSEKQTQITQLNNGRWAFITGNGFNSKNGKPVLVIQYLDAAGLNQKNHAIKLVAGASNPTAYHGSNGLASPRLVDLTGNGRPDIAYAGDLQGNLWKFDLSSNNPNDWKTALGDKPLFSDPDKRAITTAPAYAFIEPQDFMPAEPAALQGGIMVSFGTGRNLTDADRTDQSVQRLYAVQDTSTWSPRSAPNQQQVQLRGGSSVSLANLVHTPLQWATLPNRTQTMDVKGVKIDYKSKRGWYMNLAMPAPNTLLGTRILSDIQSLGSPYAYKVNLETAASANSQDQSCAPSAVTATSFTLYFDIRNPDPSSLYNSATIDRSYGLNTLIGGIISDPTNGKSVTLHDTEQNVCITDPTLPACNADPQASHLQVSTPTWRSLR